ncbi:restriction endonuclease subunit S [Streptomyces sp. DH-12]|uniref:restriction endonuclease subunit S n=1 Tax=Streptomyces sp. DH-12 TaxID=2072509 RepID=UPI0013006316|nr:restriction endonuclease subunit S [Streptomyces sp. DH-12]
MKVGRVARLISGVGFPHQYQGKTSGAHPFLKVSDLASAVSGYHLVTAQNWVDQADLASLGARLAPKGAIVFPKVGAAMLKNPRRLLDLPAAMDNNLMAIVPNSGEPRFWLYALSTIDLGEISAGGALPYVNEGQIRDLHIPFPSVEQQRHIADFLDAETARIDDLAFRQSDQSQLLADRDVSNLSEVYQNLTQEYGSIRLRHILLRIEQGWSPQCDDRQVSGQEWGVVKAGCVNGGIFDPTQHKALPDQVSPRKEYALKEGDLLMSRASGSTELIGSVGIVPRLEHNLLLCDKVYRLSLDSRLGQAEFVARMLRSHMVREHIKMGISGGEGMANNLPIAVVKDCVLPKAPLNVQTSTARKLDRDFSRTARVRNALQRSIKLLAERRQALITAAVTGQFDVSTASGRNVAEGVSV